MASLTKRSTLLGYPIAASAREIAKYTSAITFAAISLGMALDSLVFAKWRLNFLQISTPLDIIGSAISISKPILLFAASYIFASALLRRSPAPVVALFGMLFIPLVAALLVMSYYAESISDLLSNYLSTLDIGALPTGAFLALLTAEDASRRGRLGERMLRRRFKFGRNASKVLFVLNRFNASYSNPYLAKTVYKVGVVLAAVVILSHLQLAVRETTLVGFNRLNLRIPSVENKWCQNARALWIGTRAVVFKCFPKNNRLRAASIIYNPQGMVLENDSLGDEYIYGSLPLRTSAPIPAGPDRDKARQSSVKPPASASIPSTAAKPAPSAQHPSSSQTGRH